MKALVFGGTGLIGTELLQLLTKNKSFKKVSAIVRKTPLIRLSDSIEFVVFDFKNWTEIEHLFDAETHVYCCVGSTKKKTPDTSAYRAVDYEIPIAAAQIAQKKDCKSFSVVSSIGASAQSSNFYLNLKGQMEDEITKFLTINWYIYRPSLLLGKRSEFRLGESFAQKIFSALSFLFTGFLQKYKPIEAATVAQAMIQASTKPLKSGIIENQSIFGLANE